MASLEREVIDTARYLRSVRPIDPEEIIEYTTGEGSIAEIESVLRAHAFDLELVERNDGTFVPASDEVLSGDTPTIEALPAHLETFIDGQLTWRHGSAWSRGASGQALRERIRELKARYLEGGSITYDEQDADAYLLYHFPRSFAATGYVLGELLEAGLLERTCRVLDIGAGVGPHLAAVDHFTPDDALIEYVAIEPSPLAEHLTALGTRCIGRNTHVSIERQPFDAFNSDGTFDLIVLGNMLSEVEDPEALARTSLESLSPDGSWLALAPADPRTSIQLREIERSLEPEATIFSPTIRLWPSHFPTDECWSFVEHQPIEPPSFQMALSEQTSDESDTFRNTEIRYSYSILRLDGTRRYPLTADESTSLPLARTADAIGERVDALVVKLSGNLADNGNPIFRVGDGSQRESCFCSLVSRTSLNEQLAVAPYGSVLRLEQALVLWNDDEEAINLVVDEETFIHQRAP